MILKWNENTSCTHMKCTHTHVCTHMLLDYYACVCTGTAWNELICKHANIVHTSSLFLTHTHACILIPFEDHKPTGLEVDILPMTQAMVLLLLCWRPTSLLHGSMGTSVHGYTGADSLKWCNSYRQKGVIWSGHHYLGNVHQPGIKRAPADETACRSGHSRNMTESVWIKRCWYH